MKEKPILFSAPMVRAILDGRKTQTRRIIKPAPIQNGFGPPDPVHDIPCHCDYYPPSAMLWPDEQGGILNGDAGHPWVGVDQLWVKETHAFYSLNFDGGAGNIGTWHPSDREVCCHYREGCPSELSARFDKWRPSIFMPRWASRIALPLVDVEAQRLHSISEEDAKEEGCAPKLWITSPFSAGAMGARGERGTCVDSYRDLWNDINGAGSWAKNPWVWRITFQRFKP